MIKHNDNILITGSDGFIGKNLAEHLKCKGYTQLMLYDLNSDISEFTKNIENCSFIFHLAGVNRPKTNEEFSSGNHGSTINLIDKLKQAERSVPILFSSSIQADIDNDYGRSKLAAERELMDYSKQIRTPVMIIRLPNVYGKWCQPNYNSVVATFCYNISRGLPITINDPDRVLSLVFIDDVCEHFIEAMETNNSKNTHSLATNEITLERLASLIESFQNYPDRPPLIPDMGETLVRNLHSTYQSYIPSDLLETTLLTHANDAGSFTELLHFKGGGQVSVNVSKPGIIKGNHWHHSKIEKFVVIAGKGEIKFRQIHSQEITTYPVDGSKPSIIDIPGGYTHQIVNTGDVDLITIIWANDIFDINAPDTFKMDING